MRKIFVASVLLFALLAWTVPALAVTWGQPDGNAHPMVGTILWYDPDTDTVEQFCTGTLIHPRIFLTAGHCTDYLEYFVANGTITLDNVKVSFDSANAMDPGTFLDTLEIITHPDYHWGPMSNPFDLGVLILNAGQTAGIPLANLPDENYLDQLRASGSLGNGSHGAYFAAVGYGSTLQWPPPQISSGDGVRRIAYSQFRNLHKAWLYLSQNNATGNGGTCYGDSGGPNFWIEPGGTEILVAVTSWGDANCVSTNITYRIDIPSSVDFIQDVIASLD